MQGACLFSISYPCSVSSCFTLPAIRCQKSFSLIYDVLYKNKLFPIDFYTKINHNYITIVRKGVYFYETCQNLIINSDASENVAYNHPDFPAYIKKRQLSSYSDFRAVSHWHDDLEFILILDGTMVYNVNGEKIPLQTGEGLFVNSRCLHYGYSGAHTECYFLCLLLSPALLSANTYFNQYFFNPLLQNVHFPYVKLSPTVQWQNLILHDLEILYGSNSEKIQAFIVLEKFAHICRLLYENMNHFPDHDKNTADLMSLTAMIGYVQKNYANKILLKNISSAGNCCKTKCTSLFQKYLSTSPMLYLSHYRLGKSIFFFFKPRP